MAAGPVPAWAKESSVLGLERVPELLQVTPTWAWGGATGRGVRVAVIDSGIDADHPALGGSVDESSSVAFDIDADGEVVERPGPHRDACGHGTACASIIHQLAPEATITSVRVLGPSNTAKVPQFVAGLSWAIDQGFDVINLSLGTRLRDWALAFYELCDRAYFANSLVVTAASNRATPSYPSLFAAAVSVACNHATDPFRFHANPNPPTEFLARGIDVDVAWLEHGYTTITGNSFAAPHIAAIAALVRSKHPELRPFQVKSVLWSTAVNVRTDEPLDLAGRLSRTRAMGVVGDRGTRATRLTRLHEPRR
jgi:subtilisin